MAEDWRSLPEAAKIAGLTVDALRKRAARGAVPSKRHGGRVFVDVSALPELDAPVPPAGRTPRAPDVSAVLAAYEARITDLQSAIARAEREAERHAENARATAEALAAALRTVDLLTARALPPPKDDAEATPKDAGRSILDRLRGRG